MPSLALQRCFNHADREAVARCPECGRFFCRECITEHEDRVICSVCLQKLVRRPPNKKRSLAAVTRVLQCLAGIVLAWFFFFLVGDCLLRIPASFHEGTLWRVNWVDQK